MDVLTAYPWKASDTRVFLRPEQKPDARFPSIGGQA